MTDLRVAKGTAPSTFSPFTNIVGVAWAPIRAASRWSSSMRACPLLERIESWNRRRSRPSSRANRS
jgi:hypothetical protein